MSYQSGIVPDSINRCSRLDRETRTFAGEWVDDLLLKPLLSLRKSFIL